MQLDQLVLFLLPGKIKIIEVGQVKKTDRTAVNKPARQLKNGQILYSIRFSKPGLWRVILYKALEMP